jgi:cell division protein FtsQ
VSTSRNNRNVNKTVKHIAITLGGIAIFVLLVSAATYVRNNKSTVININIDTLGEKKSLLVQKDIKDIIERTYGFDLVGVPINEVDVLSLENLLKNVPHIKDANVHIDAQNEVHVNVIPRKAIIRIVDEFGSDYFLDEDGIRLPISSNFTPRVMVAHGEIPQYHDRAFEEKKGILYDIYSLGLKVSQDPFLAAQIDQIYINNTKQVELIPKIGKQEILFGSFKDMEDKLENLVAFYKNGIAYKGWRKYKKIDLRYNKQVVCR